MSEAAIPVRGADISFTSQMEAAGVSYRSPDGHVEPVERILRNAGATHVRVRVWVDPPDGYSDLRSALAIAKRAHAVGLDVLLDLHYSDFWADEGRQEIPEAWRGQDLATLSRTVHDYTRDTVVAFARQGTALDMVQIGNEVTLGMLWPEGQVFRDGAEDWAGFGALLRAGVEGARAATADDPPQILLHSARSGNPGGARWFYDNALAQDVDFDVIALSYYPAVNGSLADFGRTVEDLAERYAKDVLVVETAYPWTLANGDGLVNVVASSDQLPDGDAFPPTPQGQAAYFDALRAALVRVPRGHGKGFFAWEPGWLPGVGWQPGDGNQYDNLTMFDWQGHALPALRAFRDGPA